MKKSVRKAGLTVKSTVKAGYGPMNHTRKTLSK
jgi:hypothetical protein